MASEEKTVTETAGDVAEKKHIDGTVDLVATEAIGGEVEELPPGYFRNAQFIGTVVVSGADWRNPPLPRAGPLTQA